MWYHQVIHVAFKYCALFIKCITKIGGKTTLCGWRFRFSNADVKLIRYSSIVSGRAGSL